MGATRDDFVKYPRTPHLFGSEGTDDDKHLGPEESKGFIGLAKRIQVNNRLRGNAI